MNRKGFASITLIIFVSVVILISVYFLFFKEKCVLKESDLYVCGNNFSSFINSFRKPVSADPESKPGPTQMNGNNKPAIIRKYFCSDVCPDQGVWLDVYFGIDNKEDCAEIGGYSIFDPAWGGFRGCGPNSLY